EPAHDLPVAAHPPVQARREREVIDWVVVDELDGGAETGPGIEPVEEIVAEQRVLGHARGQRGIERIDVVDPLADEAAFVEEVLVHIRYRGRVRVDAAMARIDTAERRLARALDADLHPRLEHAVAFGHPAGGGIEARAGPRVPPRARRD